MKEIYEPRIKQLKISLRPLGNISSRPQFGGYGVLADGVMFGVLHKDDFYLRASERIESLFLARNMNYLRYPKRGLTISLRYFQVDQTLWAAPEDLLHYAALALKDANDDILQKECQPIRIKNLPNMKLSIERLLWEVGVHNYQQLKALGAKNCYLKLCQLKKTLGVEVLLALEGAITGYHRAALPVSSRNELLAWFKENKS